MRHSLSEVRTFLDAKHKGLYAMVNLCDERDYQDADFPRAARIMRYPFEDHHAPALRALHAFCERAHAFMNLDGRHVLAVHCKAGKGRTGLMSCALLLHLGYFRTADDAIAFYNGRRTKDGRGLTVPSQVAHMTSHSIT